MHSTWYLRALTKLYYLKGRKGINEVSFVKAKELLHALSIVDIKPDRIVRTAEDTVSMWKTIRGIKLRVLACEDGNLVVSKFETSTTHEEFSTIEESVKYLQDIKCETT